MRRHADLDRRRLPLAAMQAHLAVDKADKTLHPIQDGLNLKLNSGSPRSADESLPFNSRLIQPAGDPLFFVPE
jgi:hypothetical protein